MTGDGRASSPGSRSLALFYGLGMGSAMALSGGVAAREGMDSLEAAAWGWVVAGAGAALGLLIKRRALSGDLTRFLFWGLLVTTARAALFLGIIVAVHKAGMQPFRPFVVGLLSVYFGCMVSEIAILARFSAQEQGD